uniref:Uncharacterized protein n=1 Tax=Ananas comosus var. bracteatus TaxID=296719 RepID=A0A6V7Q6Y2_ANACO|nr:unnamed protein product [Ananas comosus var. bracteatus]
MVRRMEGGGDRLFVSREGMEGVEVWESSYLSRAVSLPSTALWVEAWSTFFAGLNPLSSVLAVYSESPNRWSSWATQQSSLLDGSETYLELVRWLDEEFIGDVQTDKAQ